jgi:hypothetical protein
MKRQDYLLIIRHIRIFLIMKISARGNKSESSLTQPNYPNQGVKALEPIRKIRKPLFYMKKVTTQPGLEDR